MIFYGDTNTEDDWFLLGLREGQPEIQLHSPWAQLTVGFGPQLNDGRWHQVRELFLCGKGSPDPLRGRTGERFGCGPPSSQGLHTSLLHQVAESGIGVSVVVPGEHLLSAAPEERGGLWASHSGSNPLLL